MNPTQALAAVHQRLHTLNTRLLRTRQKVYALEARAKLQDAGTQPHMPIDFRSQFGADLLLYDLFDGRGQGFFIEAGAFDGYNYSVTYGLEAIGWTGLLVEAIPERYRECVTRRPSSRVVHAAPSRRGSGGTAEFIVVDDYWGGMLSRLDPSAAPAPGFDQSPKHKVAVPLTSLDKLLVDHAGPIDVAVIDVEGSELDVLDGFDLSRYRPRVMLIEADSPERDAAVRRAMSAHPYACSGKIEPDLLFIHADEKTLLQRINYLAAG